MKLNNLLLGVVALTAPKAVASPIAGTWQGPCEVRGEKAVKFTYVFSEANSNGQGSLAKTKIYYDDRACTVYNHTGRKVVTYLIGALTEAGYYPIDVNQSGSLYYDIAALSDDRSILRFGVEDSRDPATRPTELSTTDRVFIRVQDEN